MSVIIQAQYDTLETIANTFSTHKEQQMTQLSTIMQRVDMLRNTWIGEGAEAFFTEVDGMVAPATTRLVNALAEAHDVTLKIQALVRSAEEEAAAPFLQDSRPLALSPSIQNAVFNGAGAGLHYAQFGSERQPITLGEGDNATFESRKAVYANINQQLATLQGTAKDVRFFQAAERVVESFEFADDGDNRILLLPFEFDPLSLQSEQFSQRLSGHLMERNLVQANMLLTDPVHVVMPGTNGAIAKSALEWDIAMVNYEQSAVESFIEQELASNAISQANLNEFSEAINTPAALREFGAGDTDYRPYDPSTSEYDGIYMKPRIGYLTNAFISAKDSLSPYTYMSSLDWTQETITGGLDYGNQTHRAAIGIAEVFQKHGLSKTDYQSYMSSPQPFMARHHAESI